MIIIVPCLPSVLINFPAKIKQPPSIDNERISIYILFDEGGVYIHIYIYYSFSFQRRQ